MYLIEKDLFFIMDKTKIIQHNFEKKVSSLARYAGQNAFEGTKEMVDFKG